MLWKYMFSDRILERGREYYFAGAVRNLKMTKDGFTAEVEGSETYQVEIHLDNEKNVEYMGCSCPYARKGNECKHMAAVLYSAYGADNCGILNEVEKEIDTEETDIKEIIESMSKEELQNLVFDLLSKNKQEKQKFLIQHDGGKLSKNQITMMKEIIDDIIFTHIGYEDYIDCKDIEICCSELYGVLYENCTLLIDNGHCLAAFMITVYAINRLSEFEMDDRGGELYLFLDECYDIWKDAYNGAREEEKQAIEEALDDELFEIAFEGEMYSDVNRFKINVIQSEEVIKSEIECLDESIEECKSEGRLIHTWGSDGNMVDVAFRRIELMKAIGATEDEVKAFREENRYFMSVRKMEIDESYNSGKLEETRDLLIESREKDRKIAGAYPEYTEKLLSTYEELGNTEKVKEELQNLIIYTGNVSDYKDKLKKMYSKEEWPEIRENMLTNLDMGDKCKLLCLEEMYRALLNLILENGSLCYMEQYEEVLRYEFPDEIMEYYLKFMDEFVCNAKGRRKYEELVKYVLKMDRYPCGREAMQKMVNQWHERYPSRKVLFETLRTAGYVYR